MAFGSRQLKGQSKSLDRGDLYQCQEIRKLADPEAYDRDCFVRYLGL